MTSEDRCELCGRCVPRLTKHHLIPRMRHSNRRNKREFDRREVREKLLMVCWPCHKTIHANLTEKELEREYNTREALLGHPGIARFIAWVRKQPPGKKLRVHNSQSKGSPGSVDIRRARRRSRKR